MIRAVICFGKLAAIIVSIFLFFAGNSNAAPQIYCTTDDGLSLAAIDTTTATGSVVGPFGNVAMGLAIDNSDGTFYTIVDSALGPVGPRPTEQLAIVDPVTGVTIRVGQPFSYWITMATALPAIEVGNDGYIYAGGVDGTFYRIDKTTGQPTLLGTQSIPLIMDYAFDSQGTLWAIAGTKNDLYTVDPSTGAATYMKQISGVTTIGSGIMGIMFDKNDVLYATNIAAYPDAHLYLIDIAAGAATDLGALTLDQPHGGDIYLPGECIQLLSGLISWWPGDDNANDIVGINSGTLLNGTTFSNGKVRKAFSFDGIDDYVEIANGAFDFGDAPFSIDFWINSKTNGSNSYILGKSLPDNGEGFDVRLDTNTIQVVGVNGWSFNIVSDASVTPNIWHHIALSSTDTTVDLYIDSILKGSSARQYITTTSNPFRIGFTNNFGGTAFNGLIDEVDIFNRALTASEIADIYNAGRSGKCIDNCTDNDSDGYAVEGGICGPVDCNDNNLAINPGASDNNCNNVDENCSGTADEGFVKTASTCGVGACASTGENICENGQIVNLCTPGQPQIEGPSGDPTCNDSKDNDCDGTTDSFDTNCQTLNADLISGFSSPAGGTSGSAITFNLATQNIGAGTAGASTTKLYFSTDTVYDAGDIELSNRYVPALASKVFDVVSITITIPSNLTGGTYYFISRADISNVVSETNETNNDKYKPITITSPCTDNDRDGYAAEGGICGPVDCNDNNPAINPGASDDNCNNVDENCSGTTDEGFVKTSSTCGVGACTSAGENICQNGQIINVCTPGLPQQEGPLGDPTCGDGQDNDCDGSTDAADISCSISCMDADGDGYGYNGDPSCPGGTAIDCNDNNANINPGATDNDCNGVDENCSDTADEGFMKTSSTCGVGACAATGENICQNGQIINVCTPGLPQTEGPSGDPTCNDATDNDCDGLADASDFNCQISNTDLISGFSSPAGGTSGSAITFNLATQNIGAGTTGASTTKLYFSADAVYDAGDIELASRSVPALASRLSDVANITINIPSVITGGTYYLISRADVNNVVSETNEANNNKYKAISISIPAGTGPDLVVSSLTGPATADIGQIVQLTDTTRNNGTETAGASITRYYWSTNNVYDTGDLELATRPVPSLAAGAADTGITSLNIPSGATAGTYYIIAMSDADNAVAESNETNNNNSRSINIIQPDLISGFSSPAGGTSGSAITFNLATQNIGAGTAGASTTKLYFSTDTVYDAGDIELSNRYVPALASTVFDVVSITITIPSNLTGGTYYLISRADVNNVVSETNESNNEKFKAITISP